MSHPKTPEDYRSIGLPRSIEWIGEMLPPNGRAATRWRCQYGHSWQTRYTDIRKGRGCPFCSNHVPKNEQDYRDLAHERGLTWIGECLPKTTKVHTLWKCGHNHIWNASYNRVYNAQKCARCNGRGSLSEQDYRDIATVRGFRWLGDSLPSGNQAKTTWECAHGHQWQAHYNNVHSGNGCPYCAGLIRKTSDDYVAVAQARGFEWVGGTIPRGVHSKTRWRCPNNHEWEANLVNVRKGTGCPICEDRVNGFLVSKPQLALHEMIGGELNFPVGRRRLDIALIIDKIPIDIEYDCGYFHNQPYDAKRDAYVQARGWRVLHIKSANLIPSLEQIQAALQLLLNGASCAEIILDDWNRHERWVNPQEKPVDST